LPTLDEVLTAAFARGTATTLAAKLLPPEPPDGAVLRPRLLERLDEARARRLTTIVAGAGYGKSTLVASWARAPACVWFSCDQADRALSVFVRGLAESLRARSSTLAEQFAAAAEGSDDSSRAGPVAAFLCRALEGETAGNLVLVLDDLHELGRTSASGRLVANLCRQAPLGFHLILCSREQPPFSIERLRGRGDVVDIRAQELALDEDEVGQVLAGVLGAADEALASALHTLTGGWPAAVRLAAESLRNARDPLTAMASLHRAESPLFSYLAEEVLAAQPAHIRNLLRSATPFERVTAELCEALGIERADEALGTATQRGLVTPLGGEGGQWFSIHQLIREVVDATSPLSREEVDDLRLRSASWLESHGQLEAAVRQLIAVEERGEIARFLALHGDELLAAGAVSAVVAAAQLVPDRDSEVEQVLGRANYLLGHWEDALASFNRVAEQHDQVPAALAWRLSEVLHFLGEFEQSAGICERVRLDGTHPGDEACVVATAAYANWITGKTAAAGELASQALELAAEAAHPRALVAAHTATGNIATSQGRHEEAIRHFERAVEEARRADDLPLLARTLEHLSGPLLAEGRYEEMLDGQSRAIELGDVVGFAFLKALALHNRGTAYLHLGRLDEAFADASEATKIYRSTGSGWVVVALAGLGEVYRERGELALARAVYEEALKAEGVGDTPILVTVRSGLARVLATDQPERAAELARRATAQAPPPGSTAGLLAQAWVALARGDHEEAIQHAHEASVAARSRREHGALAESLELEALAAPGERATALDEALGLWRRLGNQLAATRTEYAIARVRGAWHDAERAKRRLQRLGVHVEAAAHAAGPLMALGPESDVRVRIKTLGGFRVVRDGHPIPTSEWQSKKARDLLKMLLSRGGRPMPREVLSEALWPGDDATHVSNRLSVALSIIRAIFDPDRRFPPDRFVASDASAVSLRLAYLDVDVEEFLGDADRGLAALRQGRDAEALELLEAAEAAYAGDFLEEDLYEDWSEARRTEARASYVAVARALALAATDRGDHDSAIRYRLRQLHQDAYDEEAQIGLVSTLTTAGRHGDARRAYGTYVARMDEIGVEPAPFPSRP